jgi:phosphoribosylglycinamide formyltransferase-1
MKISFLASHGGSAAKHIIMAIREKHLDARIGIVITNNKNSDIYRWCIENTIEVAYLSGSTHPIEEEKDREIYQRLRTARSNIIVLSGYMKKIGAITLAGYSNKILNIHPSLLPMHGGKGLYGDSVHESVLRSGDKKSGATVHFINAEYDEGPIVLQKTVDVVEGETIESLKTKVQAIENELYLNSIQQVIQNLTKC